MAFQLSVTYHPVERMPSALPDDLLARGNRIEYRSPDLAYMDTEASVAIPRIDRAPALREAFPLGRSPLAGLRHGFDPDGLPSQSTGGLTTTRHLAAALLGFLKLCGTDASRYRLLPRLSR